MKGRVKNFNEVRGFGFIRGEDGKEYFVHITDVMAEQSLYRGRIVEFDPDINEKGNVARAVYVHESDNRRPVFIEFGSVRIKLSNIKNYGISSIPTHYAKVFEKRQYEVNKYTLFGERSVKKWGLVDTGERIRLDESSGDLSRMVNSRIYSYRRCLKVNGNIIRVNPSFAETWEYNDAIERRDIEYLYVTTYQNENYRFVEDEVEFDIHKKCEELDEYML